MGQYYRPIVLKEDYENESYPCVVSLQSWDMGNGAKLMEHSYVGNNFVETFAQMIHKDNKKGFYDHRVVWCGDYGEPINGESLYRLAQRCNVSEKCKDYINEKDLPYQYVINADKEEYVKVVQPSSENELVIHPLPLLIAYGNGQGGGDYYGSDMELIGSWAFDHVYVANEIPDGYTEIVVDFVEDTEEP